MTLSDSELPGLFQSADRVSQNQQLRFLRASRLRLGLVVLAALGGVYPISVPGRPEMDAAAIVTVLALVGAIVTELWLFIEQPEQGWYDGRALAESAKTLGWRFAVRAVPFPADMAVAEAERRLLDLLQGLMQDAQGTPIEPSAAPPISSTMRSVRAAGLDRRRAVYLEQRVGDQARWYQRKARWNIERARRWRLALLMLEAVGVVAALLRVVGIVKIDLAGVVAALIGAGVAWLATKQHANLGRAYAYAGNELGLARTRLEAASEEHRWAQEVADAEEAISREHTMWRASRASH
ncbi:DUF4231 domain-containing protein [Actinomycetes bacterium KLBMP 9759]